MPTPLSSISTSTSAPRSSARIAIPAMRSHVLRGVREQVDEHLLEPRAVAADEDVSGGQRERHPMVLRFDEASGDVDRTPDDRREVDELVAKLDLAGADPRDVEQIVDDAREMARLARHRFPRHPDSPRHRLRAAEGSAAPKGSGESGLRNSCPSIARNSFLRRSASVSSSSFSCSAFAVLLCPSISVESASVFCCSSTIVRSCASDVIGCANPSAGMTCGMLGAHLQELLGLRVMRERVQRIGAVKRERVPCGEARSRASRGRSRRRCCRRRARAQPFRRTRGRGRAAPRASRSGRRRRARTAPRRASRRP